MFNEFKINKYRSTEHDVFNESETDHHECPEGILDISTIFEFGK
jgi:hypothetical protein